MAPGELIEALKHSERVDEIPFNHRLEEHSKMLKCSFFNRQMPKTTSCRSNDCNDDFVFIKNYKYSSDLCYI